MNQDLLLRKDSLSFRKSQPDFDPESAFLSGKVSLSFGTSEPFSEQDIPEFRT